MDIQSWPVFEVCPLARGRIAKLPTELADIFIAVDTDDRAHFRYGGTRLAQPQQSDDEVNKMLVTLMAYESGVKNGLINWALRTPSIQQSAAFLPAAFSCSQVGGARCLIRPRNHEIYETLAMRDYPNFSEYMRKVFVPLAGLLNDLEGAIKLTPDFGPYANVADMLVEYTEHVLGIGCERGGCGGKSSYTACGLISCLESAGLEQIRGHNVTLIGCAGALGRIVLDHFLEAQFPQIAVCDLAHERVGPHELEGTDLLQLPAQKGRFTDVCLVRGGVIVATTYGKELAQSNWSVLPANTLLALAHNLAIPAGQAGLNLVRELQQRKVRVLPGQLLTLGGALTSRIEWYWRKYQKGRFPKELANKLVRAVTEHLAASVFQIAQEQSISVYEAMLQLYEHQSGETVLHCTASDRSC